MLGLALRHLLHDDAGMLLVDVDDDFLDRLLAVRRASFRRSSTFGRDTDSSKPSRRIVSIRMPSCNSPRPATSIASLSSDSANAQRHVAFRFAQQPVADHAARDLVALGAGERRVVDAERHRQRRRIDRLRRRSAPRLRARRSCARRSPPGSPAIGDDVARERLVERQRAPARGTPAPWRRGPARSACRRGRAPWRPGSA